MSPASEYSEKSPNHLLSSLTPEDYKPLSPHLQRVTLDLGDVLGDHDVRTAFAYFPTTCVVSLVRTMENGSSAEVALTGNDGLLGTSFFLGGNIESNRAVVGIAGEALRLDPRILRQQFVRGGSFQKILLRYTEALISQISLIAACNRMHTFEKRFCRWLLLIHDRMCSDELILTQEFIASMLGGRRETVTVAAGRLQDWGFIQYSRGHMKIVNRAGLENTACECYRAVCEQYQRLLGRDGVEPGQCGREAGFRIRANNALS